MGHRMQECVGASQGHCTITRGHLAADGAEGEVAILDAVHVVEGPAHLELHGRHGHAAQQACDLFDSSIDILLTNLNKNLLRRGMHAFTDVYKNRRQRAPRVCDLQFHVVWVAAHECVLERGGAHRALHRVPAGKNGPPIFRILI